MGETVTGPRVNNTSQPVRKVADENHRADGSLGFGAGFREMFARNGAGFRWMFDFSSMFRR
jgi:hypothetical protein